MTVKATTSTAVRRALAWSKGPSNPATAWHRVSRASTACREHWGAFPLEPNQCKATSTDVSGGGGQRPVLPTAQELRGSMSPIQCHCWAALLWRICRSPTLAKVPHFLEWTFYSVVLETLEIRENGAVSPSFVSVWPALNSMGKGAGELMEGFGFLHWFSPLKTKEEISGIFIVYIFQECAVHLWARKTIFRLLMLDGMEVFRSSSLRVLELSLNWQECWATELLSHVEAVPGGGW